MAAWEPDSLYASWAFCEDCWELLLLAIATEVKHGGHFEPSGEERRAARRHRLSLDAQARPRDHLGRWRRQ